MIASAVACQNLGPRETRKRRLLGYLSINVGLVLAIVFIWQNVSDYLRMLVFIPFFFGYLGVLQSLQKTCVFLALKGKQNLDQGNEEVVDAAIKRKLFTRSIWTLILTTIMALLCTYLTLAIHSEMMMKWPEPPPLPANA